MEQPNYYGILPATVRYDKSLSPHAKLLFCEFSCLSNKEGYTFASNEYFAELYGVTERAISKWISSLQEKGYIYVDLRKSQSGTIRKIYILMDSLGRKINSDMNIYSTAHTNNGSSAHTNDSSFAHEQPFHHNNNKVNNKKSNIKNSLCDFQENQLDSTEPEQAFELKEDLESDSSQWPKKVNESVIEKHQPKWLEDLCINCSLSELEKFEQQPKAEWIFEKIKTFGADFVEEVFCKINEYCIQKPKYAVQRKNLSQVFNTFAKGHETSLHKGVKSEISKKYNELFKEDYQFIRSDFKHIKELSEKVAASIREANQKEATEIEIIQGIGFMMSKLPDRFTSPAQFKVSFFNTSYQQIKNEIKNGKGTNNNKRNGEMSTEDFFKPSPRIEW